MSVAAVCRRHDISTSMVFRWRIQFGFGAEQPARLVSVAVAGTEKTAARVSTDVRSCCRIFSPVPDGMTAVDLPDGRRVFAPDGQRSGGGPGARRRAGDQAMMIVPAGVKVHLALGYTDMRKGMDGLADAGPGAR